MGNRVIDAGTEETLKQKIFFGALFATIIMILLIKIVAEPKTTTASTTNVQYRYTNHYVEAGESIWSIAKDYMDEYTPYSDIREYVYEIKKLNNCSDDIKAGSAILVPYWIPEEN